MSEDELKHFEHHGNDWYIGFAFPFGIVAFLTAWVYAVYAYGFFLGVGLGWLPAIFIGIFAGFLWPLVLISILAIAVLIYW